MRAEQPYLRPRPGTVTETIEIKRSHFIGLARRTETEEAAREFIAEVKAQYPDARHHCTAYIIHQDSAQPIQRSNDDGEPAGTAGQPMLEVLKGTEILDVTVVVVRYFGGIKLGTGGLVRAYQEATRAAVGLLSLVRRHRLATYTCQIGHDLAGKMEADLRAMNQLDVVSVDYGQRVCFTVAAEPEVDVAELIAAASGGQAEAEFVEYQWRDRSAN